MLLINPYRFAAPRSSDADVNTYILAVEAADGQQLEAGVITAVENFVLGCKSDGIWGAIKASCILAGARTLNGALMPLVGNAPTNLNFVSQDYNRKNGLAGAGSSSTKTLNSNRNNNSEPQNSRHLYCWLTTGATTFASGARFIGGASSSGGSFFAIAGGTCRTRCSSASTDATNPANPSTGGHGVNRSASNNYKVMSSGATGTANVISSTSLNEMLPIHGQTNAKISFYSIGQSLDLDLLNARVSTLMTALAAAIP